MGHFRTLTERLPFLKSGQRSIRADRQGPVLPSMPQSSSAGIVTGSVIPAQQFRNPRRQAQRLKGSFGCNAETAAQSLA
jgi:hypothetical protein